MKLRIRLTLVVMFFFTGFAVMRIGSCALDSIGAYNNRLAERWLENVAKVHIGMTSEQLFDLLGKPSFSHHHENGVDSLYFEIPYTRQENEKRNELIPSRFFVELTEGIVSDARMGYR